MCVVTRLGGMAASLVYDRHTLQHLTHVRQPTGWWRVDGLGMLSVAKGCWMSPPENPLLLSRPLSPYAKCFDWPYESRHDSKLNDLIHGGELKLNDLIHGGELKLNGLIHGGELGTHQRAVHALPAGTTHR